LPFWGWKFSSHKFTCASVAILGHFFIAILGGNSQIFGILLPRLDTTLPRAIFFAHKFTCTGVAILGHFFIPPFLKEIAKFSACGFSLRDGCEVVS
jgi:hypothetical protein